MVSSSETYLLLIHVKDNSYYHALAMKLAEGNEYEKKQKAKINLFYAHR